ncbi:MAG: thioredoxin family protein [Candidatus Kaiserbacteria bacterium]|nr:thioredoxin family protein [Candidatus Kaiserbacteria bacterium]
MGTTRLIIISAAVVILGGAGWFALSNQNATNDAMMKETDAAAQQANETMAPKAEETMVKKDEAMMDKKDTADTMMAKGSYEAYSPEKVANAGDSKVLLFFHAEWCPLCRPLDADIKTNLSGIPSGVIILKVNYDTEIALRQKYGVTYQHTIVEVDSKGALIKKWSVSNPTFAALIAEIK